MERELWLLLYRLARQCDPPVYRSHVHFADWEILCVYYWALIHDRPVLWACQANNWPEDLLPMIGPLPSQPTMSRRLWTRHMQQLQTRMEQACGGSEYADLVQFIDGKPLLVGSHSKDPDAHWGRVRRGWAKGYKLHAIYDHQSFPLAWEVTSLNVAEPEVAARLIPALRAGGGYLLGDSAYDSNPLHNVALAHGRQLVAQRKRPKAGLGHCRHSPGRLRSIHMLQTKFGQQLYSLRETIERQFAWLTNHGGGLAPLPNWVRRSRRVTIWIRAKLLAHAAYIQHTTTPKPLATA